MEDPGTIAHPGKAHVEPCPDCRERISPDCPECEGTGLTIYRACPSCGDLGWAYRNGRNDQAGMICQLGCGSVWTTMDPGWRAQHLAPGGHRLANPGAYRA